MPNKKSKLDQLGDFLLDLPDEHEEALLVEELDGFLAGVIVCPETIPPSRWMPHIWSEAGDGMHAPVFNDLDHANKILGLIMDHYNSIALSLLPNSGPYEPLFAVDTRNDEVLWEIWAEGFNRAVGLSPATWLTIIESGDEHAIAAMAGLRSLISIARPHSGMGGNPLLLAPRSQPGRAGLRNRRLQEHRAQRSLPLWFRQEIQEMPRR